MQHPDKRRRLDGKKQRAVKGGVPVHATNIPGGSDQRARSVCPAEQPRRKAWGRRAPPTLTWSEPPACDLGLIKSWREHE